jgi:hypothetical protein
MLVFRTPNREPVKNIIKKPLQVARSPISVLNDGILLRIFYLYRPHIPRMYVHIYPCWGEERWWYKLVHVSRRWRRVIFEASSLLDLHLVCTHGVPVADMLAHSPPLPLAIFYFLSGHTIFEKLEKKDEKGARIALYHNDRVRRVTLYMEARELKKLLMAMAWEFPILESLTIGSSLLNVTLPQGFGAPNLYYGNLIRVALPVQCPILTTTGLVSLQLRDIPSSGYFPPSYMLASLSQMPQLKTLCITFEHPVPNHDVRDTAPTSNVTLPNLRKFEFGGATAYVEDLCARMAAPVLSVFSVNFFKQLTCPIPCLVSFMRTSGNPQFYALELVCGIGFVRLQVSQSRPRKYRLNLTISYIHLDSPIPSAIRLFDAFSPVLSVVKNVTLIMNGLGLSPRVNEVNRTQWRGLLRIFSNVTKLRVSTTHFRGQGLSHSLRTEDGDLPLELLPNLEEVTYSGSDDENAFTPFINEREALGRPVHLELQSW